MPIGTGQCIYWRKTPQTIDYTKDKTTSEWCSSVMSYDDIVDEETLVIVQETTL